MSNYQLDKRYRKLDEKCIKSDKGLLPKKKIVNKIGFSMVLIGCLIQFL